MLPSTSSNLFSQNLMVNHEYPRRLLMNLPLDHLKVTLPAPSPHNPLDPSLENNLSSNLIMILMLFLCALICSFCVNFFIKSVIKCLNLNTEEPNHNINTIRDEITKSGLDKRALKTFPVVKYSKEVKIHGLSNECVICLLEFGKGEKVRILPKCNHGFHVKCIDKWLSLHTSCPTCRQSLINTCQKIIGCDNHQVSSSTTVGATREAIAINVAPLEREDLVGN